MALPQDHSRAIDQLRTRLSQLSTSLGLLKASLEGSDPLPTWPSLQATSTNLGSSLEELASTLCQQRQLFTSLHAYPLPSFPGVQQEVLLQQLLRKKLDPKAENWIEESLSLEKKAQKVPSAAQAGDEEAHISYEAARELWSCAGKTQNDLFRQLVEDQAWDDVYTIKEREDGVEEVVTGLQRKLDEDDGEEDGDDEGDEKMEDAIEEEQALVSAATAALPSRGLDSLLKFASGQDEPELRC